MFAPAAGLKAAAFILVPVAMAFAVAGARPAVAGCHLIDCVENVYVKPQQVAGHSCEDLWILRNSIYKDAGYCFTSTRGQSMFDNTGCQHSDQALVPLNDYQRHNVRIIKAAEAAKSC
jgi:hypothetical protein